jgi:hypothetical protein
MQKLSVFVFLMFTFGISALFAQNDSIYSKNYLTVDITINQMMPVPIITSKTFDNFPIYPYKIRIMNSYRKFKFGLGYSQLTGATSVEASSITPQYNKSGPIVSQYFLAAEYYFLHKEPFTSGVFTETGLYSDLESNKSRYYLVRNGFFVRAGLIHEIRLQKNLSAFLSFNVEYDAKLEFLTQVYAFWNFGFRANLCYSKNCRIQRPDSSARRKVRFGISSGVFYSAGKRDHNYPYMPEVTLLFPGGNLKYTDDYYKNGFVFVNRERPFLEFRLRTPKNNIFSLGFDYFKWSDYVGDVGFDGTGHILSNMDDLELYFQYSHPLVRFLKEAVRLLFYIQAQTLQKAVEIYRIIVRLKQDHVVDKNPI